MKYAMLALVAAAAAASPAFAQSDAQIRQSIIRQSIAAYPGPCACPYNRTRNGSQCGGRSAYSRPGGHAPICYPRDVSEAQIRDWRRSNR
ncbi:MAG TPA: hypothetical protein VEX35_12175 [Allosphingosinicella sp.]|nr:hypothetical protein [Allosphingosinicella sp.]